MGPERVAHWADALDGLQSPSRRAAQQAAHRAGQALARSRGAAAAVQAPLEDAPGRVLAEDLRAACAVPHYASSAMDGYAVNGPGPWRLVLPPDGHGLASTLSDVPLDPGTAVPVVTGGVLPDGTSTVLREEFCRRDGPHLRVAPDAPRSELAGRHIRPAGTECAAGERLLPAGRVLSPVDASLAAVAGLDSVRVRAVPRVALLLTGSEVLTEGVPRAGFVRDAFSMSLPGIVAGYGGHVGTVHRVPDDAAALARAWQAVCGEHDLVVTTGGTSRSRADLVRPLVQEQTRVLVDEMDLQPGHPVLLGGAEHTAVLGLPGNPLGAVVSLVLLGGAFLAGFLGRETEPFAPAAAGADVPGARRERLVPARREHSTWVPCRAVGSNMLRGLAAADGLLAVPPGGLAAGDPCESLTLPW